MPEPAEAAVEFSAALRNMRLDLESAKKALLTEHQEVVGPTCLPTQSG